MITVKDAILSRKSVRSFTKKKVSNKIIKYINSILAYLLVIIFKVKDTLSKSTGILATGFHFLIN